MRAAAPLTLAVIVAGVQGQVNLKRGCDTLLASIPPPAKASKSLWLGNGVWKNGAQTACTAGATGCCSVAEIDELLNPPPSDGNQPDALCPAKADNVTDCIENKGGTSCECDHPETFAEIDDNSQIASFTLSNGKWQWFTFTVKATQLTEMVGVDWNLTIANTDPDINAALLVGRCLGEVECGKCPPRCATLQSARRTPQVCSLTDYCPGYTSDPVSQPAWDTNSTHKTAACYNATTNVRKTCNWFGLKKKTDTEAAVADLEDVHFYVGIYGMERNTSEAYTVTADLRLEWNAVSFAAGTIPRLILLALCSLFATLVVPS